MKAKSSRPRCDSVPRFANVSDKDHYHMAWEKLGLQTVRMLAATFLCQKMWEFGAWPPFEGEFLYHAIACVSVLAFFWWKQVLVHVWGFFVCGICRRLKRLRDMSLFSMHGGVVCSYCAELEEKIRRESGMHISNVRPFLEDGRPLVRPPVSRSALPHVGFSGSAHH